MVQRTYQRKPLSPENWREEVYAFQRSGHMSRAFRSVASNFGRGAPVKLANPDIPAERALIDHVLDGCDYQNIPNIPPIAIVKTHIVNAASVSGSGIFFTTGLLERMPNDQIRAVAGHELAHHRHAWRDSPLLLGINLGIMFAIERCGISFQTLGFRTLKPRSATAGTAIQFGGMLMDTAAAGLILTPWRWFMELESDREGAQFAGAKPMRASLETLQQKSSELKEKRQLTLPQQASNWLRRAMAFIISPLGSHPPMDMRIGNMRKLEADAAFAGGVPINHPKAIGPAAVVSTAQHQATVAAATTQEHTL